MRLVLAFALFTFQFSSFTQECVMKDSIRDKIGESIFKVVPINLFAPELTEKRAREIYQNECLSEKKLTHERLNCEVLKSCQGNNCKKEFGPHGSAFLLDDGKSLATAWHVLYNTHSSALLFLQNFLTGLNDQERNEKLSVLRPAFILLNRHEEVIFDSRKEIADSVLYEDWGNPLSPIYAGLGRKQEEAYGYYENIPDDYVLVSLPRSIGTGLEMGSIQANRCNYSVGHAYDGNSEYYKISGGSQATIIDLQRKITHFLDFQLSELPMPQEKFLKLSTPEILSHMGYGQMAIQQQLAKYDEQTLRKSIETVVGIQQRNMRDQALQEHSKVFFFNGAVLPGQSGAPLVNERGQVVGITTNGFVNSKDGIQESHGGAAPLLPTSWKLD